MHVVLLATRFAALAMLLSAGAATAADLRVLTPGGAATGVRVLAVEFTGQSGTQVDVMNAPPLHRSRKASRGRTVRRHHPGAAGHDGD
jgi:accessory colonization factor AcfC